VLVTEFASAECQQLDAKDKAASPLLLMAPFNCRLDWWWKPGKGSLDQLDIDLGGGSALKTWAGRQSGPQIFKLMKQAAKNALGAASPFNYDDAIDKDGKAEGKTVSAFYFDSRREGTSLDVGFSPDEQELSVREYPAVESLALVGLQRFRPFMTEGPPRSFVYITWAEPLSAVLGAAAVCGAVKVKSCGSFRFVKPSRGGEYARMFSRARRERSKDAQH
jgi:CRISPR-associated protein Csb3